MEITLDVPAITIGVSVGLASFIYYLDRRRAKLTDKGHKSVIAKCMTDLDEMVTQILLDVKDLDTYESDEMIPERLSQYLARNYKRAEFIISTIEVHGAMCTTLSGREKEDVMTTVQFTRWLLDNYHPQGVREEARPNVWTRHPSDKLRERAREMHACVSRFGKTPMPPIRHSGT